MRRKHTDHSGSSDVDAQRSRNPLLRRSDRIQSRVRAMTFTLLALMLPLSVWLAASTMSAQQDRVAEQQLSRHSVTAVTTTEARADAAAAPTEFGAQTVASVDATWTFRGDHDGQVTAEVGTPAGTEIAIWVDDSGERSLPPITSTDVLVATTFIGFGSFFAVGTLLMGTYAAVRFRLDAEREAEWDRAIKNFLDENSLS
ncbi:hypothetical protein C5142_19145 [Rhodococcus sp. BGS-1C]|uniref:Rv1733c family protein n=2 Tax=Mycobacteriales TaxID=85007 RepID=UPI0019D14C54